MPDTKRGRGQSTSGPIYEKWGWGWGGQFASGPLRKVGGGGGQIASGPLRKVGGGGGQFASGPLRKVGGGGGGGGNLLQVHYEKWGGSDVSSPIGVWGKAPEASQAGTRTT